MKTMIATFLVFISCAATANSTNPEEAVDAFQKRFGVYEGKRRNHTKGLCFAAQFKATKKASEYTQSSIFNGQQIPVIGRFSHAGGNLQIQDKDAKVLGMALHFKSASAEHKMAMLNIPFFPVPHPEAFVKRLQLAATDDKTKATHINEMATFKSDYPSIGQLEHALSARNAVGNSYSDYYFNSIHTFYLNNRDGQKQAARWVFYPVHQHADSKTANKQSKPVDFENNLKERLLTDKMAFDMIVSFPDASDKLDDPTYQWITNGERTNFGRLTLTGLNADCEDTNFDPNLLSTEFEASNDPILSFRSGAYAVSFSRRLSEQ